MSAINITTFSLDAFTTLDNFIAHDALMQEWAYVNLAGIQRRTTARSDDGTWVVVQLFDTLEHANVDVFQNNAATVTTWASDIHRESVHSHSYTLL